MDNIKSITSLINTYDDGKSSGKLRKIFNMPAPQILEKYKNFISINQKNYKIYKSIFNKRINMNYSQFILLLNKYIQSHDQILFDIKINDKKINAYLKKYLIVFKKLIIKKK